MFISPEELRIPQYVKDETLTPLHQTYKETADLEAELPHLDVLYMTRIQQERFFNEEDYLRSVSYTPLTLPTKRIVEISEGAVALKKKQKAQ